MKALNFLAHIGSSCQVKRSTQQNIRKYCLLTSMSASRNRSSLRELRLATASSILADIGSLNHTRTPSSRVSRTFQTAPQHVLNLSNVRSQVRLSRENQKSTRDVVKKESRRIRKKREWLQRQDRKKNSFIPKKPEETYNDDITQSQWAFLPDLVLGEIFKMLPFECKIQAALTCQNWSRNAHIRSVWSDFIVHDHAMTHSRFNFAGKFYEVSWQKEFSRHYKKPYPSKLNVGLTCRAWSKPLFLRSTWASFEILDETLSNAGLCTYKFNFFAREDEDILDSVKASNALNRIGKKLRNIAFIPQKNLHNICQFMRMMRRFCEMNGDLPDIESFRYVFPCDFARKSNEVDIYGTGGMVLQDMKDLLAHLPGIKRLELIDLQLDGQDAAHVLDEVSEVCGMRIRQLTVINTSRRPFSLLAVASFVNLRCLTISPHNLWDDLVECIGDMPKLRNLTILTNAYTESVPTPVDYKVWKKCRKSNKRLRVHMVTEGKHSKELTFQARAPTKSIVYNTPYTQTSTFSINLAVELYRSDLECYAHQGLPRFHMSRSFADRPDSAYLYLVRECMYIHTLMIREKISSATVLLIAYTAKNLRYFHVRKNAVLLKCEWPRNPEWSLEFYEWLKKNSRTYEDLEREVSQIFGFRWYPLNDKQYKLTTLNLNIPYYYEGFEEC